MQPGKAQAFSNEAEDCSRWMDMRGKKHACRRILWILSGPAGWRQWMIGGMLCQESNTAGRTSTTDIQERVRVDTLSRVRVPSGCQYSMRLDRLHRAYPSLHPFGVVYSGVPEQLNIKAVTGACMLIDGCSLKGCVRPHLQWHNLAYATEIKVNSTAWLYRGPSRKIVTITFHYITLHYTCIRGRTAWKSPACRCRASGVSRAYGLILCERAGRRKTRRAAARRTDWSCPSKPLGELARTLLQ